MKSWLKNTFIKTIKKYLRFRHLFTFLIRVVYLNTIIFWFDRNSPLKGNLGKKGFHYEKISENSIKAIEDHYSKSNSQEKIISENLYLAFTEIFNKFKNIIIEYIGKDAKIDGIKIFETNIEDSKKNISSNWHTDCVGIRLKLFICYQGDGSQPTYIICNNNPKNLVKKIFKDYTYEVKRWIGMKNIHSNKNQIGLNHCRGSAFIFDTNNLHRGSYEKALSGRKVLIFEFSTNKKHKFLSSSPIGTIKNYNDFKISKMFRNIDKFNFFLDTKRIREYENYLEYRD